MFVCFCVEYLCVCMMIIISYKNLHGGKVFGLMEPGKKRLAAFTEHLQTINGSPRFFEGHFPIVVTSKGL